MQMFLGLKNIPNTAHVSQSIPLNNDLQLAPHIRDTLERESCAECTDGLSYPLAKGEARNQITTERSPAVGLAVHADQPIRIIQSIGMPTSRNRVLFVSIIHVINSPPSRQRPRGG